MKGGRDGKRWRRLMRPKEPSTGRPHDSSSLINFMRRADVAVMMVYGSFSLLPVNPTVELSGQFGIERLQYLVLLDGCLAVVEDDIVQAQPEIPFRMVRLKLQ